METVAPPASCKVYTPFELASAMVNAVYAKRRQVWLEPSCGKGSFIQAIANLGVDRQDIFGVDLDRRTAGADQMGRVLRGIDFLEWSESRIPQFECAVGNPPYLPICSLPEKSRIVASAVCDFDANPVGLRANIWYPFLIRSIELLKMGGCLAFVLPAASEFADYAALGRSRLTNLFARVDVVRSRKPLFTGVSEGVVVLIAKGKGERGGLFRRHVADGLTDVVSIVNALDHKKARTCTPCNCQLPSLGTIEFRDVVDLRIGAVTGDAGYFVMCEKQRLDRRLPISCVVPVLSRSSQIEAYRHTPKTWEKLRDANERVWLFHPKRAQTSKGSIAKYLELNEDEGGCHRSRYKVRNRSPWYLTPLPTQPDLFLTGMSSRGLWCCMNEFPTLTATNTLYVGTFKDVVSLNKKYAWALAMLTSTVQKQVKRKKRIYADGLVKMEPSQIASLELPIPPPIRNARSVYRKAVSFILAGKPETAAQLADFYILSK